MSRLAWCVALAWSSGAAWAQAADDAPALKSSPLLQEKIPADVRSQQPSYVRGYHIEGQPDIHTVVEGDAELRRSDTVIRADRLEYTSPKDLAQARGNVHLNRAGNVYDGTALDLRIEAFEGFFNDARYRFLANQAHGESKRIDFIDKERTVVHNATYTTCERTDEASWKPAWILRADTIRLDTETDVGVAENAVLEFKGFSTPAIPSISFPLSDKRKSGLLPPTLIAVDSRSGPSVSVPYYWNIAPNRDATITTSAMVKRGLGLGGQFRYLEPSYSGLLDVNYLPYDRSVGHSRWGYTAQHSGTIASPIGNLGLNLNLNRVSDDDYWRDFPRYNRVLAQRLLPQDASLNWSGGDMSAQIRTLKWQTLQDPTAPIVPPYDRAPQLNWRYNPQNLPGGFDASLELDHTRFEADPALTLQPNGQRSYALAQISRPFLAPGGFVTPKLILNATRYNFDTALSNGQRTYDRATPTVSLDSGLVFERDTSFLGRSFTQTLEPRAFYTYTPYRDQSLVPLYDTAPYDFNFATVYTENSFAGNDRIADNNRLTLGVTSRLLDPKTGAEALRLGVAQLVRFSDQRVQLPGVAPATDRLGDVLLGAAVNWVPQWSFNSMVEYNYQQRRSVQSTIGGRYSPSPYRTISAAYRYTRGSSETIDVGWQWPLNDLWGDKGQNLGSGRGQGGGRWYSVGRLNYSMMDKRLVDTVVGLEYDGCCWIGRVVLQRLQNSTTTTGTQLLFQFEFVGFSRLALGADPLDTLKRQVPQYENLRGPVVVPSRFTNYD
ncbi:MAG: LPS-assembly protein LptD [Acidovorax sp.]